MATRDVQSEQTANVCLTSGEATEPRQDAGGFVEFSRELFDLSLAFQRVFLIISSIGLVAMAIAYLCANAGYERVAIVALAVFGLAVVAWAVVATGMVWKIGGRAVRWWVKRLANSGKFTDKGAIPQ